MVRCRLPNRYAQPHAVTDLPIRILLVSPRPENAHIGYIDHRHGNRDPVLATDLALDYRDAVELFLLLETLGDG